MKLFKSNQILLLMVVIVCNLPLLITKKEEKSDKSPDVAINTNSKVRTFPALNSL